MNDDASDTVIVGIAPSGFPVKAGERGASSFLQQAFDAAPKKPRKNEQALRAVRPNAGIRSAYQRKLDCLIAEMQASYVYWVKAAYRKSPPLMAQDASTLFAPSFEGANGDMAQDAFPARDLADAVGRLAARWQRRFEEAAPELASYFARSTANRSDAALRAILRKGGFSVRFRLTNAMRDILRATIEENVSLIRSIPQRYHTEVQGIVMRSVSIGRDLSSMTKELQEQYGVTRRRAEFISLDQNNKATSALTKARQLEVGIEEGVWMHSHAGREPRPTHVANDGKRFNIATGWFDPDPRVRAYIMPGYLPRCRCTWKPVVKGFS